MNTIMIIISLYFEGIHHLGQWDYDVIFLVACTTIKRIFFFPLRWYVLFFFPWNIIIIYEPRCSICAEYIGEKNPTKCKQSIAVQWGRMSESGRVQNFKTFPTHLLLVFETQRARWPSHPRRPSPRGLWRRWPSQNRARTPSSWSQPPWSTLPALGWTSNSNRDRPPCGAGVVNITVHGKKIPTSSAFTLCE